MKSIRSEQSSYFKLILLDETENPVENGKSFAKEDTEGKLIILVKIYIYIHTSIYRYIDIYIYKYIYIYIFIYI